MSFEKLLDISGEVEEFVKEERDALALNIDRRVVQTTPFETASAKRNWLVSFNSPDQRRFDEGRIERGAAEARAITEGQNVILSSKAFGQLYIQNNLPYIERLNEGWSKQAPSRYIDTIIVQEVNR